MLRHPQNCGSNAQLQAAYRVVHAFYRPVLASPQIGLGASQDLYEQLLLGVEVPVEDALSHTHSIDNVRDGGWVVAVGGEALRGICEELCTSLLAPRCKPSGHGGQPSGLLDRSVK